MGDSLETGRPEPVWRLTRPAVVLGAVTLAVWLPTIVAARGLAASDVLLAFRGFWAFGYTWLSRGVLPLWNPHIFSGLPFLNEPHGLFYPPHLLLWLLPNELSLPVVLALHTWLAGLFVVGLARRLGLRDTGALLAAVAYMLSGVTMPHVLGGHVPRLEATAWLPAVLWAWRSYADGPRVLPLLLGAVAVALLIAVGHMQFVFYTLMAAGCWALVDVVAARRSPRAALRLAAGGLLMVTLGIGLMAVQIVPGLLWTAELARGNAVAAFRGGLALAPSDLATMVIPGLYGDGLAIPWGRPGGYGWETSAYVGLLVPVLAGAGIIRRRPGRHALFLLGLVLIGGALAMGEALPLHGWFFDWVPGFKLFRVPARIFLLPTLGLALLAGSGCDRVVTATRHRQPLAAPLFGGIGLVYLGLLLVFLTRGEAGWHEWAARFAPGWSDADALAARHQVRIYLWIAAALLALITVGSLALRRRPGRARWLGVLLVAALAVDLCWQAQRYIQPVDLSEYDLPSPIVEALDADSEPFRVVVATRDTDLNAGMIHGFEGVGGYGGAVLGRTNAFMARLMGTSPDAPLAVMRVRRYARELALLNARYLLVPAGSEVPPRLFDEVVTGGGVSLFRLTLPLPRAWIVRDAVWVETPERALDAVFAADRSPFEWVVLEGVPVELAPSPPIDRAEFVAVRRPDPNRLELEVDMAAPGFVVVSEIAYPGWTASLDGHDIPILTADFLLRAVWLEAGHHRVEMRFRPVGWRLGLAISGLALGVLLLLAWMSRRRPTEQEVT